MTRSSLVSVVVTLASNPLVTLVEASTWSGANATLRAYLVTLPAGTSTEVVVRATWENGLSWVARMTFDAGGRPELDFTVGIHAEWHARKGCQAHREATPEVRAQAARVLTECALPGWVSSALHLVHKTHPELAPYLADVL